MMDICLNFYTNEIMCINKVIRVMVEYHPQCDTLIIAPATYSGEYWHTNAQVQVPSVFALELLLELTFQRAVTITVNIF